MEGIKLSVLDVVKQNFSLAELSTYIHRALYTGEHTFLEEAEIRLTQLFTSVIENINGDYCDAPISGFLLIYQKYYIAIVEGSEETISRQVRKFLFECNEEHKFGRSKILIIYHNIEERQFSGVTCLFKVPPTLASALNQDRTMEYYEQILETILDKLERLTAQYVIVRKRSVTSAAEIGLDNATESKLDTFPEYALLEFILASPYCFDLRQFAYMADSLPDYQYSFEKCWPTPYDFTPTVNYERELADIFVYPLPKSIYDVEEEKEEEIEEPAENKEGEGENEAEEEG